MRAPGFESLARESLKRECALSKSGRMNQVELGWKTNHQASFFAEGCLEYRARQPVAKKGANGKTQVKHGGRWVPKTQTTVSSELSTRSMVQDIVRQQLGQSLRLFSYASKRLRAWALSSAELHEVFSRDTKNILRYQGLSNHTPD